MFLFVTLGMFHEFTPFAIFLKFFVSHLSGFKILEPQKTIMIVLCLGFINSVVGFSMFYIAYMSSCIVLPQWLVCVCVHLGPIVITSIGLL